MKGTLLGGFKVYIQDGKGLPLSAPLGRVKFYKANTAEPLEVYSSSAMDIPLGPIVYTDIHGYLPDVWLRTDSLYDVIVERKLQNDPETWVMEYEVDDVGEVIPTDKDLEISNVTVVNSVSELRDVDHSSYGTAIVMGYYTPGDVGEQMVFRFDPDNRKEDDGGSIIIPNDKGSHDDGRWLQLIPDGIVDVRRFGAIPDDVADVYSQIINCCNFCLHADDKAAYHTVGFLKFGKYNVGGSLNLDIYARQEGGKTHHLHFVINDGVVFYCDKSNTFTLGSNTDLMGVNSVVGGKFQLVVPSTFKGAVHYEWYSGYHVGESDDTVSNAVVYGKEGMGLKATDSIVIYKEDHKIDLWDVTISKRSPNKGFSISLGNTEVFSFEQGQDKYFRFNGKMYATSIEATIDLRIRTKEGEKYTYINRGDIEIGNEEGNKTIIDSQSVNTGTVTSYITKMVGLSGLNLNVSTTKYSVVNLAITELDLASKFPDATNGDVVFLKVNEITSASSGSLTPNLAVITGKDSAGNKYKHVLNGRGLYQFLCVGIENGALTFFPMFNTPVVKANT